jgi:methionyl-tRNA formyltransferase
VNFAFAGTPQFAAWVLADLIGLGRRPSLVLTQPDRPKGRGLRVCAPAAAQQAGAFGVPHVQACDINSPEMLDTLRAAGVKVLVVASFGQIFQPQLLDAVLCINIHASLLPAYRGAAPIQRALAAGEDRMGVTIMRVTEHLDAGPVALQRSVSVDLRDDAGTVSRLLAMMGAVGVSETLQGLADGTLRWTEQTGLSSYACKLSAEDTVLDTGKTARAVHNQIRSLSPSPGTRAMSGDLEFKILRSWPYGGTGMETVPEPASSAAGIPGMMVAQKGRLFIGCAEGVVEALVVQPAAKARMRTEAFLRGYEGRLLSPLSPVPVGEPL